MDIGDNDDESFTFRRAANMTTAVTNRFFQGGDRFPSRLYRTKESDAQTRRLRISIGVRHLGRRCDRTVYLTPVTPDGDMIDAGDNQTGGDEDVVGRGPPGDDTVLGRAKPNDTVLAGSGDDSVLGHGGDDVIFGDPQGTLASPTPRDRAAATIRESLNWNLVDDPNGAEPDRQRGDPIKRLHPEHGQCRR